VQTKTRSIVSTAAHGGKACATMAKSRNCNTHPCPIDCEITFNAWSTCTKSCGAGTQTRDHSVSVAAAHGGDECPASEQRTCNKHACAIDCALSKWSIWTSCTKTCNGGVKTKTRSVVVATAFGGKACSTGKEVQKCNTFKCPINCVASTFGAWGSCSEVCGSGVQTKHRSVVRAAAHGGKVCITMSKARNCNSHPCAVDCQVKWNAWTTCTKSCNTGTQTRDHSVTVTSAHGGDACPPHEERTCNSFVCPIDCKFSKWSAWDECTKTCGGGVKYRYRKSITPPKFGGRRCDWIGSTKMGRECNIQKCSIDCKMSGWNYFGKCSKTCDTGSKTRTRSMVVAAAYGGKACKARVQRAKCNSNNCAVHCKVSGLSSFSKCSKTCGGGWKKRTRSIVVQPKFGGNDCLAQKVYKRCNTFACPVDCRVSTWTEWSTCGKTCTAKGASSAKHQRHRGIVEPAMNGGKKCPSVRESRYCATTTCPQHCVHKWGAWSSCSKSCGGGSTTRKIKKILKLGEFGGKKCPARKQFKTCNELKCPIDCVHSKWNEFGRCSKTCTDHISGTRVRSRSIISHPKFGGKKCGSRRHAAKCNTFKCPVDCIASTWLSWSACSSNCGDGVHSKTRTVVLASANGGAVCPDMVQYRKCMQHKCPINCKYTWGKWSKCTKSCEGGFQRRYAQALNRDLVKNGGEECPDHEERVCNVQTCPTANPTSAPTLKPTATTPPTPKPTRKPTTAKPTRRPTLSPTAKPTSPPDVACQVSDFSAWTQCSQECGGGIRTRERMVTRKTEYGGEPCPALFQVKNCNTKGCKKPCGASTWARWSTCSSTCGGGITKRRAIKSEAGCPEAEEKVCNQHSCPKRRCENIVGGHKCSHVQCKTFRRPGHALILRVQHHHKEEKGENHCCSSDDAGKTCGCVCW
jgi:hypothetical protein